VRGLLAVVGIAFLWGWVGAGEIAAQATVVGRVLNARCGAPIATAMVRIEVLDRGVGTDAAGRFVFPAVPAGSCRVRGSGPPAASIHPPLS
jgi:hypothetical protein